MLYMKKNFLFAGFLLLLAACSKENSDSNGSVNLNTVSIKNMSFSPQSLRVNINATVTWVNDDNITHTVTADDGSFDSGDILPGAKFMYTFSNTGTYNYHCTYHLSMTGTIIATGIR